MTIARMKLTRNRLAVQCTRPQRGRASHTEPATRVEWLAEHASAAYVDDDRQGGERRLR
jgi:hypothetical protein